MVLMGQNEVREDGVERSCVGFSVMILWFVAFVHGKR